MVTTIGALTNVPNPGSAITSPWAQDATRLLRHTFATKAALDAATWPGLADGASAWVTADATEWNRIGGAWVKAWTTPPHVRLTHSVAQGVAAGAAVLTFDTESVDVGGCHAAGAPTRITVPTGGAGFWAFGGGAAWATGPTGYRSLFVRKNGADRLAEAGVPTSVAGDAIVLSCVAAAQLADADYLELVTAQAASGSIARVADHSPLFWAYRLSN